MDRRKPCAATSVGIALNAHAAIHCNFPVDMVDVGSVSQGTISVTAAERMYPTG